MGVCRGTAKEDVCGVCNGPGIKFDEEFCDCHGNKLDECRVCGGDGVPEGWADCDTPPEEEPSDPEEDPADKIKKRVTEDGGAYYNTWIRVTLMWENCNDLDLSVTEP